MIVARQRKAETFPSKLDHYAIITTGKISAAAQLAVQTINQEHEGSGLFAVELLAWEKITNLLRQYPDIEQQFYGSLRGEEISQMNAKLDYLATLSESAASASPANEPKSVKPLDPYSTVPPQPPNYIVRSEVYEPIIQDLLSTTSNVALTALEGMGGVGKTMVALGVCSDERIRQAFPDGIVWLTIGKQADMPLEKRIEYVAKALNSDFREYTEATYRTLMKDKAVLIVLDDVWTPGAIGPFRLYAGRSRLLYTTRDKTLSSLGDNKHEIGIVDEEHARCFLAHWSGREAKAPPEPYASHILSECQGLVLGLALIGSTLRGQPDSEWAHVVSDLKKARLKNIVRPISSQAYNTLHGCIALSVNALEREPRKRYLKLAVLLEDMSAPEKLLQCIWGEDEGEVHRTARLFVDRSLATRDAEDNIRLHDFQLDYIRGEHPKPAVLALAHSALLRSIHVIRSHPGQFTSQMSGRLLAHIAQPGVKAYLNELDRNAQRPRLRPIWPALRAAGGPDLRILEGHTAWVSAVALSCDGRFAVSGSDDQTLRVWDLEGKQPPRVLKGHLAAVNAVALTGDGRFAVSGSDDRTLRVWDLEGKQPPRVLEGHTSTVNAVALSADCRFALSGCTDGTLRVWDLEGKQPPRVLEGHTYARVLEGHTYERYTYAVYAVALSGDGRFAVSGSSDRTLRVWDLEGKQPPRILEGHSAAVNAAALSADGRFAISGSDDHTLRVWDLEGKQPPRILEGHMAAVNAVALTGDCRFAVSGSSDRTLRVWDLKGRQPPLILEGHTSGVRAVALSDDGRLAVSASYDESLVLWDLKGTQRPPTLDGRPFALSALAVSGDGRVAISDSPDQTLRVWHLEGKQPPRVLEDHTGGVCAVALSGDSRFAVSGSQDHTLRVWDLVGKQPPRILDGHTASVWAVALSGDGRFAISGSHDRTVRVWDLERKQPPRILEGHKAEIWAVALSGDGRFAVSGSDDHTLRVWDLEGNKPPRILDGYTILIRALALSGDGRVAVTGSTDGTLWVWDLEGKQPPFILEGHTA
jgi:WD40 repeat protein